jgi:hypothetical protein
MVEGIHDCTQQAQVRATALFNHRRWLDAGHLVVRVMIY